MKKNVIASAVIGNSLEWYDYLLYACFAEIFGRIFFPSQNPYTSLMLSFAVFAVGFIARPLGGVIFGYIGDEFGRKVSLTMSIILIAIPTTAIGLLPTYEKIGILAPILLIIMRILQGISLGGEFSASSTFLVESAPKGRKGFFGSLSTSSIAVGMLFASLSVSVLYKFFSLAEVELFAWRIPFLLSFIIGLFGLYTRSTLEESSEFCEAKNTNKLLKKPFSEIFRKHRFNFFVACGIFMCVTIPFYTFIVFSKTMMSIFQYQQSEISFLHTTMLITFMLFALFFGFLSDRINARKFLIFSAICIGIFIVPFIWVIKHHITHLLIPVCILAGILIATFQGIVPTLIVQSFPIAVRSSGVALSYSITAAIFGGTAPLILTFLMKSLNVFAIALYVIFGCTCSVYALISSLKRIK